MKLAPEDRVVAVERTDGSGDVLLLTRQGKGIRFDMDQVSQQGRTARGVRGMGLEPKDEICDITLTPADDDDRRVQVAVFTNEGAMKRTPLADHPRQRRGGKGLSLIFQRAKRPHRCIAVCIADRNARFEVVDSEGHEHPLDAEAIPSTVRDGRGHNPVKLKRGVSLLTVGRLPDVPLEESEGEEASGEGDASPEAEVKAVTKEVQEAAGSQGEASAAEPPPPMDETPADSSPELPVDASGQGLLLDLVPPGGKDDSQ